MVATLGRSPGLTLTLKRLVELLEGEEEDDYGVIKPTDYAFKTAMNLILEANALLTDFPQASVSTDHEGSVRLAWSKLVPECEVCLFCPARAEAPIDIYHVFENGEGVEDVMNVTALVKWLEHFNRGTI
jgi:hypothetical protein